MFKICNITRIDFVKKGGLIFDFNKYVVNIFIDSIDQDMLGSYLNSEYVNDQSISIDTITQIITSLICVICNSIKKTILENETPCSCTRQEQQHYTCNVKNREIPVKYSAIVTSKVHTTAMNRHIKPICLVSGNL